MTIKSLLVKIGADIAEFESKISGAEAKFKAVGDKMTSIGKTMTAAVTLPIMAVGAAALKAGIDVDKGMDAIRIGTGLTGDALKSVQDSARNVAKVVPQSILEVSQAVADLNTRTGATGPVLEDLARRTLDAARMMGVDSSALIASFTRTLGDWGIELEDAPDALDKLFAASQVTGIGLDRLNAQIVQYGAPLRQMGFSFEQAAAMVGKFEKEGVNAELVMGSLRIALGKMAQEGKPAIETFEAVVQEIKNAGDASEANKAAIELFGARAGPDMAAAIREGRLEIGDLVKTIEGSSGAVKSATDDTRGFSEMWGETKNRLMLALEPIGTKLLTLAENYLPKLIGMVEKVFNWFDRLPSPVQDVIMVVGGLAAAAGPVLIVLGKVIALFPVIVAGLGAVKTALLGTLGPWGLVAGAAVAAGIAFGKARKEYQDMNELYQREIEETGRKTSKFERILGSADAAIRRFTGGVSDAALAKELMARKQAEATQSTEDLNAKVEESEPILAAMKDAVAAVGLKWEDVTAESGDAMAQYQELLADMTEAQRQATEEFNGLMTSEVEMTRVSIDEKVEAREDGAKKEIEIEEGKTAILASLHQNAVAAAYQTALHGYEIQTQAYEEFNDARYAAAEETAQRLTELEESTFYALANLHGNFLEDTLTAFRDWGEGKEGILKGVAGAFMGMAQDAIGSLKRLAVQEALSAAQSLIKNKAVAIASVIKSVMTSIPFPFNVAAVGGAIALVSRLFSAIKLGEGGIVTRPTFAMIGEKGPEAVIPLDKAGALAGLGGGVNVKAYFYGDIHNAGDLDEISRRLAQRVTRAVQGGRA